RIGRADLAAERVDGVGRDVTDRVSHLREVAAQIVDVRGREPGPVVELAALDGVTVGVAGGSRLVTELVGVDGGPCTRAIIEMIRWTGGRTGGRKHRGERAAERVMILIHARCSRGAIACGLCDGDPTPGVKCSVSVDILRRAVGLAARGARAFADGAPDP